MKGQQQNNKTRDERRGEEILKGLTKERYDANRLVKHNETETKWIN